MYKVMPEGQIQFLGNSKPRKLHDAQRSVRDEYVDLCKSNLPRSVEMAQALWATKNANIKDVLFKEFPYYKAIVASASRAYAGVGPALLLSKSGKNYYHMDITITLDELRSMGKDVADLVAKLAKDFPTQDTFTFLARDLKHQFLPKN